MGFRFNLEIDVVGRDYSHSPTAHRAIAAQMLDQARQVLASSKATSGELSITAPNMPKQVLGSWELIEEGL